MLRNNAATAEGNVKDSLMRTAYALLLILGGKTISDAAGKASLPIGVVLAAYGYYKNSKLMLLPAFAMMANPSNAAIPGSYSEAIDRMKSSLENTAQKMYLDKIPVLGIPSASAPSLPPLPPMEQLSESVSGIGGYKSMPARRKQRLAL